MKFFQIVLPFLLVLIPAVRAQNATQALPACAVDCMGILIPQSSCSVADQNCICNNVQLQSDITNCVKNSCTVRESLATQNASAAMCNLPYHDDQPLLRRVTIPLLTLATLFYLARITARLPVFGGEFGPDDYMITAAYLFALGFSVILLLMSSAGLGKDIWNVPFSAPNDQVTYTMKLFVAFEKTYILTVWMTKLSILLLYLRIFPDSKFRVSVKFCLAYCTATVFCLFFACLFKCWPISFSWNYWDGEHHGSCSSQSAQGWANAGLNIFGDLYVIALPLPTIWKMSLSRGKRFGIMFMFGVGIFITIVSIIRLFTLKAFSMSENPTWDFTPLSMWSLIEVDVSIICACLPGTRNFYSRIIRGKILGRGRFAHGGTGSRSTSRTESPFERQMSHSHKIGMAVSTAELWPRSYSSASSDATSATAVAPISRGSGDGYIDADHHGDDDDHHHHHHVIMTVDDVVKMQPSRGKQCIYVVNDVDIDLEARSVDNTDPRQHRRSTVFSPTPASAAPTTTAPAASVTQSIPIIIRDVTRGGGSIGRAFGGNERDPWGRYRYAVEEWPVPIPTIPKAVTK